MEHNGTATDSSSGWEKTSWSPFKRLSKGFVPFGVPVLFTLALTNNTLLLYAFGWPRRVRLRGASSVQLYYALLAAADLLALLPFAYYMIGLWIPTDVRPFFRHNAGCKSVFYLGYMGESCAQWLLVALCAERFVALSWPLWSRLALTYHRSLRICEFIAAACALVCLPAAVCFEEKNFGCGNYPPPGIIYASLMAYVTIAQKYAYSTLAMLALSVAIAVKLLLIARDFRRASVPQMASVGAERPATSSSLRVSAGEKARRRGNVSAALTSVVLALLQSSLYLSSAVLWGLNAIGVRSLNSSLTVTDVGSFVDAVGILVHAWNLYVYLLRVSELRDYLCGCFCPCRRCGEGPQSLPRSQLTARLTSQSTIDFRNCSALRSARNSCSSFSGSPAAAHLLVSSGALPNSPSSKSDQFYELKL